MQPAARQPDSETNAPKGRVSLRKNFLWTLFGNFSYGGCQWAMVVVIAKLGTPEMVGRFALAFAVTAPVVTLANMNLRAVLATDQRNEYKFGDYLTVRLVLLAIAALLSTGVAASAFARDSLAIVALIALAKAVEAISDVYLGYMQQHERMDAVSRSLVLKGITSLAGLTAGLWLGHTIEWGAVGLILAWVCGLVAYDMRNAAAVAHAHGEPPLRPVWTPAVQLRLARLSLPLGCAAAVGSLLTNVPRFFIERALGPRELGFYAAMAYFMIVGGRVVTALGESASPRLARYRAESDLHGFRRILASMIAVGVAVGLVGIVIAWMAGGPILAAVYRPEYAVRANVLVLVMLASALSYIAVFLQYAMTALRTFRIQPVVVVASLFVIAAACQRLVPSHGSAGAAIALCAGLGVQLIANALAVRNSMRELARSVWAES